ncbi:MAG: YggS family pyridoxal phosphate-dependent enzyme [Ignavibacteria bacterium]|jgi:pyridoxal phosphate enzyme (YggS family)|nr:YggS family pyridoxal phosphate-dependent enzyme [Ignavibacteria bacterium]MCU7521832.1 YggS family pyridoxal phosphate-dependent enzyme [Ignavibacteria bacterium]HEX2963121.1 YggS family pyridoxal phosphate-dependent enzyme [Ignavibacteriales bacterium]
MISENINIVRDKINSRCLSSGRKAGDVRLIAVSKNTGIDSICQALESGITDLGENKAQELTEKVPLIDKNVNWHFLGHLQTNKVKYVVPVAFLIHSVDSIRLAEEINRQAVKLGKVQQILLEVKTSEEATKYGVGNLEDLLSLASFCREAPGLSLQGLMTMAPFTDEEKLIRKSFSELRNLKVMLNERGFDLTELSMGMTHDYEIAIEEGATMLRVGTAIFGERDYTKSWREQ